ncbi:MAG TPA: ABC transporter ATP-binding protein [Thermoanaerobaculia bacterium]|nr:ABC transporter ATP-binding protein [Thermoanaerobaculia bacterium]
MSLSAFFWRYARRYLGWIAASALALLLFGVASGLMFALLPPLFDEVLLAEGERPSLGGIPTRAEPSAVAEEPAASGPLGGIDRLRDRISAVASGAYQSFQDRLGVREGNPYLNPLTVTPVLFVLVFFVRGFLSFFSTYTFQRVGFGITTDIRNDLYEAVLRQSLRFHSAHPSGEIYSRVVHDVGKLQVAVSNRLLDLFQQTVTLIVCLGYLFLVHFRLATFCLIAMPAFIYPIARFGKSMRRASHRSQERLADLSSLLAEGVRSHRVVKAFGMEDFEGGRFRDASRRYLRINLRAQLLAAASSPVVEGIAAIGGAALFVYAGKMIRQGDLTVPLFLAFLTAVTVLYDPIRKLNKVNLVFQEAVASAQRVRDLLEIPDEIVDRPLAAPIEAVRQGLRFEGVTFGYGETRVLSELDLEIAAGEVVALVGPSGAGKSTVVNLLPRFFDPDAGRITIDGVDIRDLPLRNLRSLIGVVTQETMLFDDTVRNNIAYGRADLSPERVREAAVAAYADEFISELRHGYDTQIGEGGLQLSGGQRQRLAIARALLKDAPILILDEATSHLDTESELLVQRAIYNLMEGRTALVIAHRLSTVTRADRIVVMERGQIVEQGSHAELLARAGSYKRLYDLQFP